MVLERIRRGTLKQRYSIIRVAIRYTQLGRTNNDERNKLYNNL